MPDALTREHVEDKITDAVVELGIDREAITPEATLKSLDLDSLDLVEVAQILEQQLGIEIKAEDVKDVETFAQVVDLVVSKVA
jgi:acyl carrier protein